MFDRLRDALTITAYLRFILRDGANLALRGNNAAAAASSECLAFLNNDPWSSRPGSRDLGAAVTHRVRVDTSRPCSSRSVEIAATRGTWRAGAAFSTATARPGVVCLARKFRLLRRAFMIRRDPFELLGGFDDASSWLRGLQPVGSGARLRCLRGGSRRTRGRHAARVARASSSDAVFFGSATEGTGSRTRAGALFTARGPLSTRWRA